MKNTDEEVSISKWVLKDRMFSEDNMYRRVQGFAEAENLPETAKALPYMKRVHAGQYRKTGPNSTERIPYIIHPLMLACHAHALGIRDDAMLAAALLHDVCEDCGIAVEDLPFGSKVRELVGFLTFVKPEGMTKAEAKDAYYKRLSTDGQAALIKAIDRCNNVSTMAHCFTRAKLVEYINETEHYILPLLRYIKDTCPAYSDAAFLLKYHILSVLESLKNLIVEDSQEDIDPKWNVFPNK